MQKEQDCLQKDLESAKTHVQDLHCQNFVKDLKLQCANAKLYQYDPKYRRPEPKLVKKCEQCRHAEKKQWEAINQ